MRELKEYLLSLSVREREELAKRCATTWPFLRNIAYGYRNAGEKLCVSLERETSGAITRKDLRPDDWHLIWPELKEESHA